MITYRIADLSDDTDLGLASVLMLWGQEEGAIPADRNEILDSEEAIFALADTPAGVGTVVGGIVFYQPEGTNLLWIDVLFVGAAWRRRGIARALIEQVTQEARRRGLAKLSFGTIRDNREMQEVGWKCGFAVESVTFSASIKREAMQ